MLSFLDFLFATGYFTYSSKGSFQNLLWALLCSSTGVRCILLFTVYMFMSKINGDDELTWQTKSCQPCRLVCLQYVVDSIANKPKTRWRPRRTWWETAGQQGPQLAAQWTRQTDLEEGVACVVWQTETLSTPHRPPSVSTQRPTPQRMPQSHEDGSQTTGLDLAGQGTMPGM